MKGLDVGVHNEVAGAGPDAEALVVADGRVDRVEREQEVGHHGSVPHRALEGVSAERLAAQVAVYVGHPEEHVLRGRVPAPRGGLGARLGRELGEVGRAHVGAPVASRSLTIRSTSPTAAANRSIIWASSSSVAV